MPRATNAPASRKRRKRVLAKAKGFRGFRSKNFRYAKDAVRKAMTYNYRDRKVRKRAFRNLWVQRINAATRPHGLSYSRFMEGLKAAGIELDRKVLSDLAIKDATAFEAVIAQAKNGLEKKQAELKSKAA
ncbi:MAG: 50S ribosomal protein L20 [Verrucomicrobiales bacterium]|nr:50S ribosomal protein L20 [Verrucomicrobiales bacterium]MCP5556779.1 50S ribosomal protein L20 [Verrucomicrobiaceae bacterium]